MPMKHMLKAINQKLMSLEKYSMQHLQLEYGFTSATEYENNAKSSFNSPKELLKPFEVIKDALQIILEITNHE